MVHVKKRFCGVNASAIHCEVPLLIWLHLIVFIVTHLYLSPVCMVCKSSCTLVTRCRGSRSQSRGSCMSGLREHTLATCHCSAGHCWSELLWSRTTRPPWLGTTWPRVSLWTPASRLHPVDNKVLRRRRQGEKKKCRETTINVCAHKWSLHC